MPHFTDNVPGIQLIAGICRKAGEMRMKGQQDRQTVTPEGKPVKPYIDGVRVRPAITHPDDRGSLCEMFNPAWGFHEEPLVYVYHVMIRPGKIKGWVVHEHQDDRIFVSAGTFRFALFDNRDRSRDRSLMAALDGSNRAFGKDVVRYGTQSYGKKWKLRAERLSPCYTTRITDVMKVKS